jgi:hypothetical protein
MSAATQAVDTRELLGDILEIGVAASTTIYAGTLVGVNASGYAVPASASSALTILGRAESTVINTAAAGFGSAGALRVRIREGVFLLTCSGAGISSVGKMAYVVDDNTVALTDGSGSRPAAGMIVAYDADTSSPSYGKVAVSIGRPSLSDAGSAPGSVLDLSVDGVVTANVADLAAFAVGTNTDGLTHVEGNVVALVAQSTASQNGLYLVGAVSGGTAALTRIGSLASGDTIAAGAVRFSVSGGTVFANTDWKNTAAGTVGTDDPAFYPARVVREAVLVAGTITISNIPILSATKSHVGITRKTANTTTSTVQYVTNGAATPGALGTASVAVMAAVAAGTINNADISTLEVCITNF